MALWREPVQRWLALAAFASLCACATPATRSTWPMLAGCWTDASDAIPPSSMIWRETAGGAYAGEWRVTMVDDTDAVDFTLTPNPQGMRLCERAPGVAERCMPAFLGAAPARHGEDVVVFYVNADSLSFAFGDAPAAFYIGRRGVCA